MHKLGKMLWYGREWFAKMVMLTRIISEDSCCNCAVATHSASWTLSSPSTEICISTPDTDICWVIDSLISA